SATGQSVQLGLEPDDCRLFMVFDGRFKLIHAMGGFRPMLFDLHDDPEEFHDLAKGSAHQSELDRLYGYLSDWGRRNAQRVTISDADIKASRGRSARKGVLLHLMDGSEVPAELTEKYRGPAGNRYVDE
ncbi:MAG: phosphonate monoester hydrolase, partial [Pseudomonadota bacterium]